MPQALDEMPLAYLMSLRADRRRLLSRYWIVNVVVRKVGSVGMGCWVLPL